MSGDQIQNEILAALPRNEYERIYPSLQVEQWPSGKETGQTIYAYDSDVKTPYIQNFTLSANRDLSRKLNLDVRDVGTKGVALYATSTSTHRTCFTTRLV